jgi:hypothetical protein
VQRNTRWRKVFGTDREEVSGDHARRPSNNLVIGGDMVGFVPASVWAPLFSIQHIDLETYEQILWRPINEISIGNWSKGRAAASQINHPH